MYDTCRETLGSPLVSKNNLAEIWLRAKLYCTWKKNFFGKWTWLWKWETIAFTSERKINHLKINFIVFPKGLFKWIAPLEFIASIALCSEWIFFTLVCDINNKETCMTYSNQLFYWTQGKIWSIKEQISFLCWYIIPSSNFQWLWKGTNQKDAVSQWRVSIFRMSSVPRTRLFSGPKVIKHAHTKHLIAQIKHWHIL